MKKLFESILKVNGNSSKDLIGDVVDLRYRYETDEESAYDGIPTVYFDILRHADKSKVGTIDLRLKMDEKMYYYGHVGYNIIKKYRGHHFSYHACKLIFKLAKEKYQMDELYLTCNPDNVASYKILHKLKGELVEVAQVPKDHELYHAGDKLKCVFRYKINI